MAEHSPRAVDPAVAGAALEHHDEAHDGSFATRLNWLRAGVLGANDGIVSTAGLVIGVAAATTDRGIVLTAGLAGLKSMFFAASAAPAVISRQAPTIASVGSAKPKPIRMMVDSSGAA